MTFAARLPRQLRSLATAGMLVGSASALQAQMPRSKTPDDPMATIPKLSTLVGQPGSELADVVERYAADQSSLTRRYDANDSPEQRRRMREFYTGWRTRLGEMDFDKLSQEGRVDYVLLDNHVQAPARAARPPGQECAPRRPCSCRSPTAARAAGHAAHAGPGRSRRAAARPSRPSRSRSTACARCSTRPPDVAARRSGRDAGRHAPPARHRASRVEDGRQSRRRQRRSAARHGRQLVSLLRRLRPDVLVVAQGSVSQARRGADALCAHAA